jgi:hypothetical protein
MDNVVQMPVIERVLNCLARPTNVVEVEKHSLLWPVHLQLVALDNETPDPRVTVETRTLPVVVVQDM